MPGGVVRPGIEALWIPASAGTGRAYLLFEERLEELELLLLEPLLALARPLEERLCALALPPLLAACARLDLPEDEEDLEEEEELRDAIACSFEC